MEDQSKQPKYQDFASSTRADNEVSSSKHQPPVNQVAHSSRALDVEQSSKIVKEALKDPPSGDIYVLVNSTISQSNIGKGNHQSTIKQDSSNITSSTSTNETDIEAYAGYQKPKIIGQSVLRIIKLLENDDENDIKKAVVESEQITSISTNNITMKCDTIADFVLPIASNFAKSNYQSRSMSLIRWVLELISNIATPLLKLEKVNDCCEAVHDNVVSMATGGNMADIHQHCVPLLRQLREQIKLVQTDDVVYKAEKEARCMAFLGECYHFIHGAKQATEMFQTAVNLMESVASEQEATAYRVVAICHYSIAFEYDQMNKLEEAMRFYKQAIETYKCVKDITEEERKTEIANAKEKLDQILSRNISVSSSTSVNMMTSTSASVVEVDNNIAGSSEGILLTGSERFKGAKKKRNSKKTAAIADKLTPSNNKDCHS